MSVLQALISTWFDGDGVMNGPFHLKLSKSSKIFFLPVVHLRLWHSIKGVSKFSENVFALLLTSAIMLFVNNSISDRFLASGIVRSTGTDLEVKIGAFCFRSGF